MKLENSRESLQKEQKASTSKKNDQGEKFEKKKRSEMRRVDEKRGKSPKKSHNGITYHKALQPKYTNYHALNALQDHIYMLSDKNMFKKLDEMRSN